MSIEKRLAASLKHDTINGDARERTIFAGQVREAVTKIIRLRARAERLDLVVADLTIMAKQCGNGGSFGEDVVLRLFKKAKGEK